MFDIAVKVTGPWPQRAICHGENPAIFFPSPGDPATKARHICAGCPVQAHCLHYATAADERGIWGGLDREQRRVIASKPANSPTLSRASA